MFLVKILPIKKLKNHYPTNSNINSKNQKQNIAKQNSKEKSAKTNKRTKHKGCNLDVIYKIDCDIIIADNSNVDI